ncbi:MAG: lamin tail domain-containing protein, partial [Myxococcota bacterium]
DCADPLGQTCQDGMCIPNPCGTHLFTYMPQEGDNFTTIHVAGTFNGFPQAFADGLQMAFDEDDGVWWAKTMLDDGEYAYKFVLDSDQFIQDTANPFEAGDGFGGFNSVLYITCAQCGQYCTALADGCAGEDAVFPNRAACEEACAGYRADGMAGDAMGDTLQCRLTLAAQAANDTDLCADAGVASMVCGGGMMGEPLMPGELVITEILKNPSAPNDATGEWFELLNTTDRPLDLAGLRFEEDNGAEPFTVDRMLVVEPGGYVVLGNSDEPYVDYTYGDAMTLANGGDEIFIFDGDTLINVVAYDADAFPNSPNTAMMYGGEYDPDNDSNNDGQFWCDARTPIGDPDSDRGTPGEANPLCAPPATLLTIPSVRNPEALDHPEIGTPVEIQGAVVTAISANGTHIFAQDPQGGPWSGIYLNNGDDLDVSAISEGSLINATGFYDEDDFGQDPGAGTLSTLRLSTITATGSMAPPAPRMGTTAEYSANETAEPWESVLVVVSDVTVTTAPNQFGEFELDGLLLVNDLLHVVDPPPVADDLFESLIGPLNFSFERYKIEPRSADDAMPGMGSMDPPTTMQIQMLLNMRCTGCHTKGGSSGGLNFDDIETDLINVPSFDIPAMDFIEPGDSANSYLFLKIEGTHIAAGGSGLQMPRGGGAPLPDNEINLVRDYIDITLAR